ncbi:hypothetical protein M9H77_03371 [Catharanthus roseus]|uniref:Uncharacterized protein n=1 Tax=Catharanthus roseus TaxID=4058 RepID=A0ACC0CBH0_CATRO|nr:hypothetical protein M9H77_03371 [Catharanthus roseus]
MLKKSAPTAGGSPTPTVADRPLDRNSLESNTLPRSLLIKDLMGILKLLITREVPKYVKYLNVMLLSNKSVLPIVDNNSLSPKVAKELKMVEKSISPHSARKSLKKWVQNRCKKRERAKTNSKLKDLRGAFGT